MPTYEFRCANGHSVEQFHKISDAPSAVTCPECGAVAERAISGGAGLVFKGSGFYITDYGKDGKGPRTEPSDPAPAPKAEAKPDAKADVKPKAKAKSPKAGE